MRTVYGKMKCMFTDDTVMTLAISGQERSGKIG